MRPSLNRSMLFVLLACLLLLPPAAARAEVIYYTEDFKNGDTPGFDPMFNHEFSSPRWEIIRNTEPRDPSTFSLVLTGSVVTTDTITFNIADWAHVVYASVEPGSLLAPGQMISFFGSEGTRVSNSGDYGASLLQVSASEIGYVQRIELGGSQVGFASVTIGVVPEPSSITLLGTLALGGFFLGRGRLRVAGKWRQRRPRP